MRALGAFTADLLKVKLDAKVVELASGDFPNALRAADVTFFSAWDGAQLAACGAIKQLDPLHGELKSMRADPAWRGRGAGKAVLLHLLAVAKARGYARVSLETGKPEIFLPARRLYESHGFAACPPFGNYVEDQFSLCMTLTL